MEDEEILFTGEIMPVKEYNTYIMQKYKKAFAKNAEENPMHLNAIVPGLFAYFTDEGEERQTGYVLKTERGSHWFQTKKEAVEYRDAEQKRERA